MTQPKRSQRQSEDAIRRAVGEWASGPVRASQLLTPTARVVGANPVLGAAMIDPAQSRFLAGEFRRLGSTHAITGAVGSSLAAQAVRPSLGFNIAEMVGIGSVTGMQRQIAEIGKQVAMLNEAARSPLIKLAKLVENAQIAVAPWKPHIERFAGVMSEYADKQREIDDQSDLFVERHGWPVPGALSIPAYHQVVSMAGAGKREVNRSMVEWFRPGTRAYGVVREVIDSSPDFASRRPLLRQVYAAQRRGEWYLVINGLLPLVEGVLLDAMFPTGTRPKSVKPGVERLAAAPASFADTGFRAVETIVIGAGTGTALFDDYAPADGVEPRTLNRHGVLHGSARRYGTQLNATKLFLLMGVLAECVELYRTVVERERARKAEQAARRSESAGRAKQTR
jgi:hypothetical protein